MHCESTSRKPSLAQLSHYETVAWLAELWTVARRLTLVAFLCNGEKIRSTLAAQSAVSCQQVEQVAVSFLFRFCFVSASECT